VHLAMSPGAKRPASKPVRRPDRQRPISRSSVTRPEVVACGRSWHKPATTPKAAHGRAPIRSPIPARRSSPNLRSSAGRRAVCSAPPGNRRHAYPPPGAGRRPGLYTPSTHLLLRRASAMIPSRRRRRSTGLQAPPPTPPTSVRRRTRPTNGTGAHPPQHHPGGSPRPSVRRTAPPEAPVNDGRGVLCANCRQEFTVAAAHSASSTVVCVHCVHLQSRRSAGG